jgi:hypothetical protein
MSKPSARTKLSQRRDYFHPASGAAARARSVSNAATCEFLIPFGVATLTSGEQDFFDPVLAEFPLTSTAAAIIRSLLDSLKSGQQSVRANKKHRTRIRMHQGETS